MLSGDGDDFGINAVKVGLMDFYMAANGTRVLLINGLMKPAVPSASGVVLGKVSGRIALQTNRDGNVEIYVMNGDGSGLTDLTVNPAGDGSLCGRRMGARSSL